MGSVVEILFVLTLRCQAEVVFAARQLFLRNFGPDHWLVIAVDQRGESVRTTAVTESTFGEVERSGRGLMPMSDARIF
jgi:sarcosine oxidase gamma subunit